MIERTMSENGIPEQNEPSVLGSLPRTRPQRPSRRRADAKNAGKSSAKPASTAAKSTAAKSATKTSTAKRSTPKTRAAKTPPPRRREPPAPKQGYEPLEEPKAGTTVHPPSGAELVESVATIFAELANVGLKAGGRVLKDVLSPLRRP
jgi:hypothetical protein